MKMIMKMIMIKIMIKIKTMAAEEKIMMKGMNKRLYTSLIIVSLNIYLIFI